MAVTAAHGSAGFADAPDTFNSYNWTPMVHPGLGAGSGLVLRKETKDISGGESRGPFVQDPRRSRAAFTGDVGLANGTTLKLESNIKHQESVSGLISAGVFLGETDKWERNSVVDTKIGASFLDDRVRLSTHQAWSRYDASQAFFRSIAGKSDTSVEGRKKRLASGDSAEGSAVLTRLEGDVFKSGSIGLTVFGQYSLVDSEFEDIDLSRKKSQIKNETFAQPNRETSKVGGTLGVGPVGLTLAQSRFGNIDHDDDFYHEERLDADLWLDVGKATNGLKPVVGSTAIALLPQTISLGYGMGKADVLSAGGNPKDRLSDWRVGANWNFDGAYVSFGGWQSRYARRQPGSAAVDWSGQGTDLSFGAYGKTWGVDSYVALGQSQSNGEAYASTDYDFGGGVSAKVALVDLPDVAASVDVGRTGARYLSWRGAK
jgi:hypothetical protein